jgi:hypothetical protein
MPEVPTRRRRYREALSDPAWSKNQGMYGTFMHENREIPRPPAPMITARAVVDRGKLAHISCAIWRTHLPP